MLRVEARAALGGLTLDAALAVPEGCCLALAGPSGAGKTSVLRIAAGLLDPRAGRGLYNSYNANNPLFRYPLDHVFHSKHFKLVRIQRLPDIGSDHFPILIELQYEPEAVAQQEESEIKRGDEELAEGKLRAAS